MPRPLPIKIGPFVKGLNTATAPHLLAPGEAQANSDCDYSNGAIRGLYGPGTGIATTTSGHDFLMWAGRNAWRSTALGDSGLNDAPNSSGTGISYVTQKTSATAATYPLEVKGVNTYRLGLPGPATAPPRTTSGTASPTQNRSYRYTFVTADGVESNPSPTTTGSDGLTTRLSLSTSSDPRVTKRRVYATSYGTTTGDFSYVGELNDNTSTQWPVTLFDGGGNPNDATRPLNWGEGGNAASSSLPYDHSVAPNLTILSDTVHSVTEGTGSAGSGIIFGAVGNIVRWSMLGYPHYWPTVNALPLPETVVAMVTGKTHTLAFTDSGAYAFSGYSDSSISVEKVSNLGILPDAGKTACETPWGIVWLSREGLVIWSGGEPQVISQVIDAADLKAGGYTFAAYYDHACYLFGDADTLVFDMRAFPALRVTACSVVATAAHVTPHDPTGGYQGLYILEGTDIKPWRSIDGANVTGSSRLDWSHTMGMLTGSTPHALMRLNRCHPYGDGAVTLTFYREDGTTLHTAAYADMSAAASFRLPGGWERGFTIKAEGSGELRALSLEAEETDGF